MEFRPRPSIRLAKGVRLNRGGAGSMRLGKVTLNSQRRASVRTPVGSIVIKPDKATVTRRVRRRVRRQTYGGGGCAQVTAR
jgi:hypothetical protein